MYISSRHVLYEIKNIYLLFFVVFAFAKYSCKLKKNSVHTRAHATIK